MYKKESNMLILTRRPGESLIVGPDNQAIITFLESRGQQIRLGITARENTIVLRKELYQKQIAQGNIKQWQITHPSQMAREQHAKRRELC